MSMETAASAPPLHESFVPAQSELAQRPLSHLHKLGELATHAVTVIQEGLAGLAIRAQIKTWNAMEAVHDAATTTKDYLKQTGGKAAVHIGLTALALTGVGLGALQESGTAYAETNQATYQIVDGPWYLHDPNGLPHIASSTIGLAQTGDTITIACHETGDTVSGDAEWDLVTDQNNGLTGLMADYGTSTPVQQGQEASQLTALGIPECGGGATPSQVADAPTSIFFSGTDSSEGLSDLPQIGNYKDYGLHEWSSGDCSDERVHQELQNMPSTVTTLAGWSRGRLGPGYFLVTASQSQKEQIHTIILFDPGNTNDFTNGGCETDPHYNYNFNAAYASWLASNPQNRLIIYTGAVSEESPAVGPDPQQSISQQMNNGSIETPRYTFAGLWKYYLAGIWNQPFADQAQMCDYPGMSHEDVLSSFAYTVQNPQNGCPVASNGQQPTAWNP